MAFGLQEIDGTVYFFDRTYGYRIDILTAEEAEKKAYSYLYDNFIIARDAFTRSGTNMQIFTEGPFEITGEEYPQYYVTIHVKKIFCLTGSQYIYSVPVFL